jgi:DNA-binding ferritin-like protein
VSHNELLGEMLDEIAGQALAAGKNRTAVLAAFLSSARSKAHPGEPPHAAQITAELLAGHGAVIRRLRENLERCPESRGEMITRDCLNGMIAKHEKMVAELQAVAGEPNQRRANVHAQRIEVQLPSCAST